MRILGFKSDKWRQWRELLREEQKVIGLTGWLKMFFLGLRVLFFPRRKEWRAKMRVCPNCPIYDRTLRRCRPYTGSQLGCGCAVWLLALVSKRCYGDEFLADDGIGWAANIKGL